MKSWGDREFHGEKNLKARGEWCRRNEWYSFPRAILEDPKLTSADRVVFTILLNFVRTKGQGRVYPYIDKLAEMCGISARQVKRSLMNLYDRWYVEWEKTGKNNIFRIFTPDQQRLEMEKHGLRSLEDIRKKRAKEVGEALSKK